MLIDRRSLLTAFGWSAGACLLPRRARAFAQQTTADLAYDPCRPEYHLLAPHNWMNDPNGPIWWKGKYHLFYQMNPAAAVWGDMHWGHAISADMVHWRHQPIALSPTHGGPDSEGCFSGSAVVLDGVPTFVYTGVQNAPPALVTIDDGSQRLRETQMLATAEDDGLLRWKKLAAPVIAAPPAGIKVTGFRDPCPWREADGWYMVVGSGERGKGGCALLYRSADLRHWEYLHPLVSGHGNDRATADSVDSGDMWECPDFFEVNGQHCLLYSTERKVYWTTGVYDPLEHRFTPKQQGLLDRGAFYAPKSFAAPNGRRILWGWITETRPTTEFSAAGWAGAISLPRVLTIDAQGKLEIRVADEVEKLRGGKERLMVKAGHPLRRRLSSLRQELALNAGKPPRAVTLCLLAGGNRVWEMTLDYADSTVRCGERSFPFRALPLPSHDLRLFLDGSVIEAFVGEREAITSRVYTLKPGETELEITVDGDDSIALEMWPLKAISPDRLTT